MLRNFALALACGMTIASVAVAKPVTIKFAIITPDGSTWTNLLHKMGTELETESKGEILFKIYPGGVSGDELDVLRKMQAGRIHGAGYSGVGLGAILPEVRILEAPLLFKTADELDKVKDLLFDDFAKNFEAKGFILLGFAEAGFVNIFSKNKIDSDESLKTMKMWLWKGDNVAEAFLSEFGIRTTPLHIADVIPGLETGMIDSFYAPPLAAISFQWHSKAKYMMDFPFVNSTGAILIIKSTFDQLTPANQALLKKTGRRYCKEVVDATRKENQDAMKILKDAGITMTKPSDKDVEKFQSYAVKVYKKSIPSVYSQAMFDKVEKALKDIRKGK